MKYKRKCKYKVYGHLGKGEEEPLPLALLPVARFEGGGEGEHGVRRQAGLQVQAHLRLTWVQVDSLDRLGPLLLPRVDHQLGRRLDRGGRPPYCACQAAVFYNLRVFSSILAMIIEDMPSIMDDISRDQPVELPHLLEVQS